MRLEGQRHTAQRWDQPTVSGPATPQHAESPKGPVDTFDGSNQDVAAPPKVEEKKGFFARIASAIGNFFASIWGFLTGRRSEPKTEKIPVSATPGATAPTAKRYRSTTPSETLRPQTQTSATRGARGDEHRVALTETARVASGATFGGVPIRGVDQWFANARGTVFGGTTDPEDNGIGAFGFATGPGGREGVAIPQRVMAELTGTNSKAVHQQYKVEVINRDTGKRAVFDIVDRGPAEFTWRRSGRPVVDLTEGAVEQLGGRTHQNSRGQTIRASGVENLSFRIIRG